jgi:ankyrin repeat protein
VKYSGLESVLFEINKTVPFMDVNLTGTNQAGLFGDRPLHIAVHWNDLEAVKILLDGGADVNGRGERADTPLHIAACFADAETLKLLLNRGASPDIRNAWDQTPLDIAILSKRPRETIALLENSAGPRTPKGKI